MSSYTSPQILQVAFPTSSTKGIAVPIYRSMANSFKMSRLLPTTRPTTGTKLLNLVAQLPESANAYTYGDAGTNPSTPAGVTNYPFGTKGLVFLASGEIVGQTPTDSSVNQSLISDPATATSDSGIRLLNADAYKHYVLNNLVTRTSFITAITKGTTTTFTLAGTPTIINQGDKSTQLVPVGSTVSVQGIFSTTVSAVGQFNVTARVVSTTANTIVLDINSSTFGTPMISSDATIRVKKLDGNPATAVTMSDSLNVVGSGYVGSGLYIYFSTGALAYLYDGTYLIHDVAEHGIV